MKKAIVLAFSLWSSIVFAQSSLEIALQSNSPGSFLVESCTDGTDSLVFTRSSDIREEIFNLSLGGSATPATDYSHGLTDDITFGEGESSITLPLTIISDMVDEDRETILISATNVDGQTVAELEIVVLDMLEVNIAQEEIEVCQGESVTLNAVLPGTYHWILDGDTLMGEEITFVSDEETTVTVFTTYGDCYAEDEIDIQLLTGIKFNEGDTVYVCLGETANITVDIIGNPTGDYVWTPMDTTIDILADQSVQINTSESMMYYLTFQNESCRVVDSVYIRVDSLPDSIPITIIPEKETYCPGEKVVLIAPYLNPASFPDIEFLWTYDAASPLSSDSLENFVFTTEDTSDFVLQVTNNACMLTDSVELIVINPPVNLSLTDTTVCPNNPVDVELLNADEFDEIMWSPEEGISCTDCPDPTIQVAETTTFTMSGMSEGCPASGSVTVNIFPPDLINVVPDTTVCPDAPVRLVALEANEYDDLLWEGPGLQCTNCESPIASTGTSNFYQVTGTRADGCLGIGGGAITIFDVPRITLIESDPTSPVEVGTTVSLSVSTAPDVSNTATFTWTVNGNAIDGTGPTNSTAIPAEGDNEIKVALVSQEGCMSMNSINIEGTPPRFEIPSAFTPTGDDINDRFKVLIFGNIRLADFKVFNRWGQVVFDGVDPDGWDGKHNGKDAPSDTYAYTAVLELLDGSIRTVRGEVALVR